MVQQPDDGALAETRALGERFAAALVRRDFHTVRACFRQDAQFRPLTPSGLREATTAAGAAVHLQRWFGEADHFELLEGRTDVVADRLRVLYRFRVHTADGWQIVEQHAYSDVRDGHIDRMDLLCSGFRLAADR